MHEDVEDKGLSAGHALSKVLCVQGSFALRLSVSRAVAKSCRCTDECESSSSSSSTMARGLDTLRLHSEEGCHPCIPVCGSSIPRTFLEDQRQACVMPPTTQQILGTHLTNIMPVASTCMFKIESSKPASAECLLGLFYCVSLHGPGESRSVTRRRRSMHLVCTVVSLS